MKQKKRGSLFLAVSLTLVVLAVPAIVNAGTPVGSQFTIIAEPERETQPAVAYNSQRDQYLVVWYNDRDGNDDIRAQRLSRTGAPVGGPFYISAMNAERRYPDVAYNSAHDQYLVVWEQYEAASGYSIKGRRVSGTGAVLDTTDIAIRSAGYNLYTPLRPAVAYASTSDRYLVVWAETWHPLPITHDVYGQVMTDAGTLENSRFSIAQSSSDLQNLDLAYNRQANRYLVVWQQWGGTLWDIHGRQVQGPGGTWGNDITIAYYTKSCTAPAVAAIPTTPTNDKFLVVWEVLYVPPNDRDIYGRLVQEDSTPGTDFWISWANGIDESSPAVAGTEYGHQYFVTWRHPQGTIDKPIKGRAVSYGGALVGQEAQFSGVNADYPAVAAGLAGDFLVAWQDQPAFATNTNIYGQFWGNRVYLPLVVRNH
ncbi:MAG: hypothetical protein KKA73_25080 [Chloroflexi bacterium]|nr:hypothetical protein [Chloroflexota bacterium]MBU1750971.1 hypothetical protein [Chloroflexota bacterium]